MQVESREQILKVPCQYPFAHYNTMQWGSMNNILKCEIESCVISQRRPDPWLLTSGSLFLEQGFLVGLFNRRTFVENTLQGLFGLAGDKFHKEAGWEYQEMISLVRSLLTTPRTWDHSPTINVLIQFRKRCTRCHYKKKRKKKKEFNFCEMVEIQVKK